MGKKALYEAIQALEAKVAEQGNVIYGLTCGNPTSYEFNPTVINQANYIKVLSVADGIQATQRYITEIPELHLPTNRLEYMLYKYGSLCLFKENGRIFVTSYTKFGELNALGDLTKVQPIDFAGKSHPTQKTVVYDDTMAADPCVILNDYTGTYLEGQIVPRAALNMVSISDQAKIYKQLVNSVKLTAKKAIALCDYDQQKSMQAKIIGDIFENDDPIIPLSAKTLNDAFKLFNIDTKLDIEGYLRAIECYERMRANFNGIPTRSPIDKKERLITMEAQSDNVLSNFYLQDGYVNRQIAIELMKKHAIIREGSVKINPLLLAQQSTDVDEGDNNDER